MFTGICRLTISARGTIGAVALAILDAALIGIYAYTKVDGKS